MALPKKIKVAGKEYTIVRIIGPASKLSPERVAELEARSILNRLQPVQTRR